MLRKFLNTDGLSASHHMGQGQPANCGHSQRENEESLIRELLRKLWEELKEVNKGGRYTIGQK